MKREAFPNLNNMFEQLFNEVDFITFCIWLQDARKHNRLKKALLLTGPPDSGKTTVKSIVKEVFKEGFIELNPHYLEKSHCNSLFEEKKIVAIEEVGYVELVYVKYFLTAEKILINKRNKPLRTGNVNASIICTSQQIHSTDSPRIIHIGLKNQLIFSEFKHEIPAFIEYLNNHY